VGYISVRFWRLGDWAGLEPQLALRRHVVPRHQRADLPGLWLGQADASARSCLPIRSDRSGCRPSSKRCTSRSRHEDITVYNAVQKLLYIIVILAGISQVITGIAIWEARTGSPALGLVGSAAFLDRARAAFCRDGGDCRFF